MIPASDPASNCVSSSPPTLPPISQSPKRQPLTREQCRAIRNSLGANAHGYKPSTSKQAIAVTNPQQIQAHINSFLEKAPQILQNALKSGKSIIFFDFDNTLFPTTVIESTTEGRRISAARGQGVDVGQPTPEGNKLFYQLHLIDSMCCEILREAQKHGEVIILTNGLHGWPEGKIITVLPKLKAFLGLDNSNLNNTTIPIFSAQTLNQGKSIVSMEWKLDVMRRILHTGPASTTLPSEEEIVPLPERKIVPLSVVSIGDGSDEQKALFAATSTQYSKPLNGRWLTDTDPVFDFNGQPVKMIPKCIKFVLDPNCSKLLTEHITILSQLPSIANWPCQLNMLPEVFMNGVTLTEESAVAISPPADVFASTPEAAQGPALVQPELPPEAAQGPALAQSGLKEQKKRKSPPAQIDPSPPQKSKIALEPTEPASQGTP